jgi:hypothetical protein
MALATVGFVATTRKEVPKQMYVLGRYLSALCVLGMGLGASACATGGDPNAAPAGSAAEDDGLSLHPSTEDHDGSGGGGRTSDQPTSDHPIPDVPPLDVPPDDDDTTDDDDDDGTDPEQPHGCSANPLPGVTIAQVDAALNVGLAPRVLANADADAHVKLHLPAGRCRQTAHGIELQGDVVVGLGAGAGMPLLGANLTTGAAVDQGFTLSGKATVGTGDIIGIELPEADLTADVMLNLGAAHAPQLDLTLHPSTVGIPMGELPLASDLIHLATPTIILSKSQAGHSIQVQGTLGAGSQSPWISAVPLTPVADLDITAWFSDQTLIGLQLNGDLELNGGYLMSGLVPLKVVTLTPAVVVWNRDGLGVQADVQGQIHPLVNAVADASLKAHFTREDWQIKLCADAALSLGGALLNSLDCLDLAATGISVSKK